MGVLIKLMPVVVGRLREVLCVRFIAEGPHDYRRMIFVSLNKISEYGLVVVFNRECIWILNTTTRDADSRCFVDDDDSFPVTKPVHLFCIRIVTGSETVGTDPVQEADVFDIEAFIDASA